MHNLHKKLSTFIMRMALYTAGTVALYFIFNSDPVALIGSLTFWFLLWWFYGDDIIKD
jgi:hypothetical protein